MTGSLQESEAPYAWVILAATAVMIGMAFGAIVNISVFLKPLAAEFGWPRAQLAAAYSVVTIATGLGGIVMGHFSDRLPVRRVVLVGSIVPGVAFFLLSGLNTPAELYAFHALMGLFGFGAIMVPLTNVTTQWFARNRGLAVGLTSAGGALGQGLMPFLARELILAQGWRGAYQTMGVIYLAALLPLALLIRNPPRPTGWAAAAAGGDEANPYAIPRQWLVAIVCVAVVFCCTCMATPIVHVVALGSDAGLGPREAAGLLTVMMIFGVAGRILTGRMADRIGNLRAYIIVSAAQTVLALWFPHVHSAAGLYVLAALFGLWYAGVMTALILCAREFSPPRNTGLSIGLVAFFGWIGMALGAWQGGLFYDLNGDYGQAFLNSSIAGVINLLILGLLYLYTVRWAVQPELRASPAGG
jgi:MFS family permease